MRIKGIPVILCSKIQVGEDRIKNPVYEYEEETIENVLVAPVSSTEVLYTLNLTGRKMYIPLLSQSVIHTHGKASWSSFLEKHGGWSEFRNGGLTH